MITPYTPVDHVAPMQNGTITQFRKKAILNAFFKAIGSQLNDVDEFFGQLFTQLDLESAVGAQLDDWGVLLQLSRNGLNDSEYRTVLQAVVSSYVAQGSPEDLIQILFSLAGATQVQLVEGGDATITLNAAAVSANIATHDIFTAINRAIIAGVGLSLNVTKASLPVFTFDLPATGNNAGFDAGHLAGLIN